MESKSKSHLPILAFDIGGVLIPYMDDEVDTLIRRDLGVDADRYAYVLGEPATQAVRGIYDETAMWQEVERRLGAPVEASTRSYLIDVHKRDAKADPELLDLLYSIKDSYRLVVWSNTLPSWTAHNRTIGLYDVFDELYLSNEIGQAKPDESFFTTALRSMDVAAGSVTFFDDLPANIAAARQAGVRAIRYRTVEDVRRVISG